LVESGPIHDNVDLLFAEWAPNIGDAFPEQPIRSVKNPRRSRRLGPSCGSAPIRWLSDFCHSMVGPGFRATFLDAVPRERRRLQRP
jgi:hypothetical protein